MNWNVYCGCGYCLGQLGKSFILIYILEMYTWSTHAEILVAINRVNGKWTWFLWRSSGIQNTLGLCKEYECMWSSYLDIQNSKNYSLEFRCPGLTGWIVRAYSYISHRHQIVAVLVVEKQKKGRHALHIACIRKE